MSPLKINCLPSDFPTVVSFDIETEVGFDGKSDPHRDPIVTIQVDVPNDDTYILTENFERIVSLLEDDTIVKLAHNVSFDVKFILHNLRAHTANVFDTFLVERVLTAGEQKSCSLESVAGRRLGKILNKSLQTKFQKGQLTDKHLKYAAQDAAVLYPIYKQQIKELREKDLVFVVELENQLAPVVGSIELYGIRFDSAQWENILESEREQRDNLYEKIVKDLGVPYQNGLFGSFDSNLNLNSRLQVLDLLAKQGINLPNYQALTLKKYTQSHPDCEVLQDILEYKKHEKRISWDYPKYVNPKTGRIHPNIHQLGARSGRLAFSDPNLQQVPKQDSFRKLFIPEESYCLITADYSQIELRTLAEEADDKAMIEAFKEGRDFHQTTAELIANNLGTTPDRYLGKTCNFAAVYGSSAEGLSALTGIPSDKWRDILRAYFDTYSGLELWYDKAFKDLVQNGYTKTLAGRKRWFPELDSSNAYKYKRIARNSPIQGGAQDIIKKSLVLVHDALKNYDARTVHTVHDEIVIESVRKQAKEVAEIVKREMIRAGEYFLKQVPIVVHLSIGEYWGDDSLYKEA